MKAGKLRDNSAMAKERRISDAQRPKAWELGLKGEVVATARRTLRREQALEIEARLRRTDPVYARD